MEMDVDSCNAASAVIEIEPVLRTAPTVASGRFTCIVCFQSCARNKRKSKDMQDVTDVEKFKSRAELWTNYEHDYSSVLSKVDWTSKSLNVHKNCRSAFFKEAVMSRQKKISTETAEDPEELPDLDEAPQSTRRSSRHQQAYSSTLDSASCIICRKTKYDSTTRNKIPVSTMDRKRTESTLHEIERTMIEFASIHSKHQTNFVSAAERIHLILGNQSLFSANVGFHRCCYSSFTSSHYKKLIAAELPPPPPSANTEDLVDEFITVIDQLIVRKKEVYTLCQLRKLWANVRGVEVSSVRAKDIKHILQTHFPLKIAFCKSESASANTSEYVLSSDMSILPDAINSIVTGEGITNHLQLKAISRLISKNIQSQPKYAWPPTPQEIIDRDDLLDKRLYNLIAWVVSPNSYMGRDGYVNLSTRKSVKVSEICQNIQSLVPGGQASLSQILLSLTMYGKTGSKNVVNDLRHLGHGIPYTETIFIMDKWAEWCMNQKSLVPSNMRKGVISTHTFDNIDWKNKNINRAESHYTNSILVQKYDLNEEFSKVSLEPDYDYIRKNHRSFKATNKELAPVNFKRGVPKKLAYTSVSVNDESHKSSLKTLLWCIMRFNGGHKVPSWSGFQELTTERDLQQAIVGYLPPIPESPTNMNVIYAEIERTEMMRRELQLDFIFLEVDQAIYTKVLDAMFKMKNQGNDRFPVIIPRMGGFHITICMLRTIYSLFNKAGFIQVLSAAGLGGLGSVKKALKGGDVNEGINLHKKMFEAVIRTKIQHLNSLNDFKIETASDVFEIFKTNMNSDSLKSVLDAGIVQKLPEMTDGMAWFMDLYLEMVDMLLNFIHFLRTGNWMGYLEVIFQFLPYCFRLNRHNYARNLSYYYVHMLSLKQDCPAAWKYLEDGGFTGSISGIPHSRLPFDHIIETTLNKECKGIGGIGGNTENLGATERWVRINHFMAALREKMNRKLGKRTKRHHVELGQARMKRDLDDVGNIQNILLSWLPQMWNSDTVITNISSGQQATDEMRDDIIDIKERGGVARDKFIQRFTKDDDASASYYDPITRQDIKLFKTPQIKKKKTISEDENQSLTEILVLYDEKKLNLKHFMNWCLFSRPWMFVKEDETSRESRKSVFRNHLQKISPIPSTTEEPRSIKSAIVDAMRVVRLIPISSLQPRTFRSWAERFVRYLAALPGDEVHLVFDNYNYPHNIPSKNRSQTFSERIINNIDQELPAVSEWAEFLKSSKNKFQLTLLLADFMIDGALPNKTVYVNKETECYYKSLSTPAVRFPDLDSNHREADQMIPMHAVHAGQSPERSVCVVADDTDIYLSLLYVSSQVESDLYFRQGKTTDKVGITYHDVKSLAANLGNETLSVLLCFHSLTGSDFTFPFYFRSKITMFRKMLKLKDSWKLLQSMLSTDPNIEEITEFVLRVVYNRPLKEKSLGEARYNMLKTKKKDKTGKIIYPSSKSLAPDQSSLKMKILRSTFIANCMTNCLNANYVPLDPSCYGWKTVENVWEPIWYEGNPLPEASEVEEVENDEGVRDGGGVGAVEDVSGIDQDEPEDDMGDDDSSDSEYAESGSDVDSESDDAF